jgi:Leucine-rich repeat (LRR) protein
MQRNDPRERLKLIHKEDERKAILSLLDIIEGSFGLDYIVSNGTVIELRMVSCGLVSIPRAVSLFPNLSKIQFQENKIKHIKNLALCSQLQILNLANNEIKTDEIRYLENLQYLRTLDLSSNQIEDLAPFNKLKELETLNLAENKIPTIPQLNALSKLRKLDLFGNPIQKLENIHVLERLAELKLTLNLLPEEDQRVFNRNIESIKEYCRNLKK